MKYNVIFADGYDHHDFENDCIEGDSIAKILSDGREIGLVYEVSDEIAPTFEAACDASPAVLRYSEHK